jgi:hypothetical protein
MALTPADPPPSKRRDRQGVGEEKSAGEMYGVLAIERHAKDDGRSLILYTRRPREQA